MSVCSRKNVQQKTIGLSTCKCIYNFLWSFIKKKYLSIHWLSFRPHFLMASLSFRFSPSRNFLSSSPPAGTQSLLCSMVSMFFLLHVQKSSSITSFVVSPLLKCVLKQLWAAQMLSNDPQNILLPSKSCPITPCRSKVIRVWSCRGKYVFLSPLRFSVQM